MGSHSCGQVGHRRPEVTPDCCSLGLQPRQADDPRPRLRPALSFTDCILGDPQSGAQLRRKGTIYRPWFSPYSYFMCADKEGYLETHSFPEGQRAERRADSCLPADEADSIGSSSSSLENTCPREAPQKSGPGLDATDCITSQDILMASTWQPAQQSGYKCASCCRMYPTLRSLESHIKGGFREGFSCEVYYRRLKALWGREPRPRPGTGSPRAAARPSRSPTARSTPLERCQ